jgi:hypothetical protein
MYLWLHGGLPGNAREHVNGVRKALCEHAIVELELNLKHVLDVKLDIVACFQVRYSKSQHVVIRMARFCVDLRPKEGGVNITLTRFELHVISELNFETRRSCLPRQP